MTAHIGANIAATSLERALLLRLLSLCLAPPVEALVSEVDLLAQALGERHVHPHTLARLTAALHATGVDGVAAAQARLFDGEVCVPPYEGSYERDPFRQARQMADVAGFYRAFGSAAHGVAAERPDHAGAELEFLAYVALRRVESLTAGRTEDAERCAEIEAAFLRDHAGRWLPVFFKHLAATARDPFHRELGRLGELAVLEEIAWHGVSVDPVPAERGLRTAVEGDEMACAAGDEAVLASDVSPTRPVSS
jgi:TorA maturation chaperone TorD